MSIKSAGHWYKRDGEPMHFIEKKDGSGLRATTLADARKLDLLPSVTTICKVLDKPALNEWRIRNAIEATLTTPKRDDETLDEFAARVMAVDSESISDAAKELGTSVHDAIEKALNGNVGEMTEQVRACVAPTLVAVDELGKVMFTERVLLGEGYAGRVDCVVENDDTITVIDFKTTGAKKLPKESYMEHRLQLSAYADTLGNTGNKRIRTANIYISTARLGEIAVCINDDWLEDSKTFILITVLWQRINNYKPQ
jgi:hypothetical protein